MKTNDFPLEVLDSNLAETLVSTARYIKSLSLKSLDTEILLISCLLVNFFSEKNADEATALAELLADFLTPKQYVFFRHQPGFSMSDSEVVKEGWGLDPNYLELEH